MRTSKGASRLTRPAIEILEARRLLFYALDFDHATGAFTAIDDNTIVTSNYLQLRFTTDANGQGLEVSFDGETFTFFLEEDGTRVTDVELATILVDAGTDADQVVIDDVTINDPSTIIGGDGNDTLFGGNAADSMVGGSGNDFVVGNGGNDRFDMGASADGRDTISGGNGSADIADYSGRTNGIAISFSMTGDDGESGEQDSVDADCERLRGGNGNDTITGDGDNETLEGNGGNDTLSGGGGDDSIVGADGADSINAGDANDTLSGGAGNDTLNGEKGNDRVLMGSSADGSDSMTGGSGSADIVDYGSRTNAITIDLNSAGGDGESGEGDSVGADFERLFGGSGNDSLTGDSTAETLQGGDGADTITGNGGADSMTGGNGNDQFRAQDGVVDTVDGGAGTDIFPDISPGNDHVDRTSEGELVNDVLSNMED
jgi:Ca2+-binding RTX toxin-like protein